MDNVACNELEFLGKQFVKKLLAEIEQVKSDMMGLKQSFQEINNRISGVSSFQLDLSVNVKCIEQSISQQNARIVSIAADVAPVGKFEGRISSLESLSREHSTRIGATEAQLVSNFSPQNSPIPIKQVQQPQYWKQPPALQKPPSAVLPAKSTVTPLKVNSPALSSGQPPSPIERLNSGLAQVPVDILPVTPLKVKSPPVRSEKLSSCQPTVLDSDLPPELDEMLNSNQITLALKREKKRDASIDGISNTGTVAPPITTGTCDSVKNNPAVLPEREHQVTPHEIAVQKHPPPERMLRAPEVIPQSQEVPRDTCAVICVAVESNIQAAQCEQNCAGALCKTKNPPDLKLHTLACSSNGPPLLAKTPPPLFATPPQMLVKTPPRAQLPKTPPPALLAKPPPPVLLDIVPAKTRAISTLISPPNSAVPEDQTSQKTETMLVQRAHPPNPYASAGFPPKTHSLQKTPIKNTAADVEVSGRKQTHQSHTNVEPMMVDSWADHRPHMKVDPMTLVDPWADGASKLPSKTPSSGGRITASSRKAPPPTFPEDEA